MLGLKVGDRVRIRNQCYAFAMWFGTGVITEVDERGYTVFHDPCTRLSTDDASHDWWHHTHLIRADYQLGDPSDNPTFMPFVSAKNGARLIAAGYIKGVHFKIGSEEYPFKEFGDCDF